MSSDKVDDRFVSLKVRASTDARVSEMMRKLGVDSHDAVVNAALDALDHELSSDEATRKYEKNSTGKEYLETLSDGTIVYRIHNGDYVRDHYNIDFVGAGSGYSYPGLPKDEIWVEAGDGADLEAMTERGVVMYNALKYKGESVAKAERAGLRKDGEIRKDLGGELGEPGGLHKEYVRTLPDGTTVYSVDGAYVRDKYTPDWEGGGHGYIYPKFIPRNEIWVDKGFEQAIHEHEVSEYIKMRYEHWNYARAHAFATEIEALVRKGEDPLKVEEPLWEEHGYRLTRTPPRRNAPKDPL